MSVLKWLGARLVVYSLATFFASWVFVLSVFKTIWYGRNYFYVRKRDTPPLCLLDPKLGNHAYIQLKEVKIHYVEAGDKSKPLMLLVHGFPEFWYSWRHQLKELSHDYWVVAIDLRGYGDSDKPSGTHAYTVNKLVDDIQGVVTGLGRTSCILVAHDWGGLLAWRCSMKYPELVEKLIILNCPHPAAFQHHIRHSLKQLFLSWYIFVFQFPYIPEMYLRLNDLEIFEKIFRRTKSGKELFCDHDIEAFKYTFSSPGAFTPPLNYYRNIFSNWDKTSTLTRKIEVPVLIVWGADDLALDVKMAHTSADFVENCTVKVISSASHWVQQDSHELVNQYIREFVRETNGRAAGLIGRVRNMRQQLVTSVSDVMKWRGVLRYSGKAAVKTSCAASFAGKHLFLFSFQLCYRMLGSPLDGLHNLVLLA